MRILVRADGSYERGPGHISKQITLCNKLKKSGNEILFVTRRNEVAANLLSQAGIDHIQIDGEVLANIDEIITSYSQTRTGSSGHTRYQRGLCAWIEEAQYQDRYLR